MEPSGHWYRLPHEIRLPHTTPTVAPDGRTVASGRNSRFANRSPARPRDRGSRHQQPQVLGDHRGHDPRPPRTLPWGVTFGPPKPAHPADRANASAHSQHGQPKRPRYLPSQQNSRRTRRNHRGYVRPTTVAFQGINATTRLRQTTHRATPSTKRMRLLHPEYQGLIVRTPLLQADQDPT